MGLLAIAMLWAAGVIASPAAGAQGVTGAPAISVAAQGSPAKFNPQTSDGNGGSVVCKTYPDAAGGMFLGVIVPCIAHTIQTATQNFSQKLIALLYPLIAAFMTLAIAMFGVKVMEGQPGRLKGEAFLLVLKIAMVIGLLQIVPGTLVPAAFSAMAEGQAVVAGSLDSTSINCPVASFGDSQTPLLWKQMDCVIGKLFGVALGTHGDGTKGPNMLLMASAFGVMSGFFVGGTFGVAVFMAFVGVFTTIVMMVVRTAAAFLQGYLYVCLMLILAPIFLPLTLMRATAPYFQAWWTGILAAMLMPIIIASYVMIALLLYDKVMFMPNSMLQKLFNPDFTALVEAQPKQACDMTIMGNAASRATMTGQPEKTLDLVSLLQNKVLPSLSAGNSLCGIGDVDKLDVSKITDKNNQPYKTAAAWFNDLFHDAAKLLITTLLINEGLEVVIQTARALTSSNAVIMAVGGNPIGKKVQAGMAGMKDGLDKEFGDASGADFLAKLPAAPGAGLKGFIDGLGNNKGAG